MKYIFASLVVVILSFTGLWDSFRSYYQNFLFPVDVAMTNSARKIRNNLGFIEKVEDIRFENISLKQKVLDLEKLLILNKKLIDENAELKKQLVFNDANREIYQDSLLIIANVRGNPSDYTGNTLLADVGEASGVEKGDTVIKEDYLVGTVKEVYETTSLIELITSPFQTITIYTQAGEDKIEALSVGHSSRYLSAQRILQSESVKIGDIFYTSGRDGNYPRDLKIGTVSEIEDDQSSTTKKVFLKTYFDYMDLTKVYIITKI